MPQFCSLFYAILQSWRPKGGAMAQWAPPKYDPVSVKAIYPQTMKKRDKNVGNQ